MKRKIWKTIAAMPFNKACKATAMKRIVLIVFLPLFFHNLFSQKEHEEVFLGQVPNVWEDFLVYCGDGELGIKRIDTLANLTNIDDTLYCTKLMNLAIGATFDSDVPNYFQDLLHKKMGCAVCNPNCKESLHDVMFRILSVIAKGDQMRFWQFYWSSLKHEEDSGGESHNHKKELIRIMSLLDKEFPTMKRTVSIAYEYFNNGVYFKYDYPYQDIKGLIKHSELNSH